jgi:GT2 family glycosyltransferase
MRAARGDVLCFMDDDAEARPDWLERLEAHYRDPAVGAVGGRDVISVEDRVLEREARRVGRINWLGRVTSNHHEITRGGREVDFLKGCNMSYRREALRPIDGRLAGPVPFGFEIDLGLGVRRRGWRVLYDPEALVDHYPTRNYRADSQEVARVVNHNQTYVLLKHLPWPRKLAFLAYTFGVGDKNTIGLARVPYLALRHRWSAAAIKAQFAGKIAGIKTYLQAVGRGGEA